MPTIENEPPPPGRGVGQPGEPEDARECVMGRIRTALGSELGADVPVERDIRRREDLSREEVVELFAERAADYNANVRRVGSDDLPSAIAEALETHDARRVGVPADLPREWIGSSRVEAVPDEDLTSADLDELAGAVTGSAGAIAETGTILLDGGALSGRRALTLVPDLHVCVVSAENIAVGVPEGIAAVADAPADRRPVTLVSGPSATSDIELSRVEGVHGPRRLEILIVG
ncbi:LUD domain-containing protein [Thermoleophilia bacterium SCSIO 60948]|nr:LUD domain-containing protein [Thermoleophilia bacterium SCSIO 60948]